MVRARVRADQRPRPRHPLGCDSERRGWPPRCRNPRRRGRQSFSGASQPYHGRRGQGGGCDGVRGRAQSRGLTANWPRPLTVQSHSGHLARPATGSGSVRVQPPVVLLARPQALRHPTSRDDRMLAVLGKRLATFIATTVVLISAGSATGARPATDAERGQILASVVKVYGATTVPAYCRATARAVVSSADVGWARLDIDATDPTVEELVEGAEICSQSTVLAMRPPGYRSYSMVWDSSVDGAKPCWAMGGAVTRDLIPAGACQTGQRREITIRRGDPVPGPRVGLRSPTVAENAGIVRGQFGSRKRCYSSLNVKVARGNKGWARITMRSDWWRVPAVCQGNGLALMMRIPGSGRWAQVWGTSEPSVAPCWMAGGNTSRALVQNWKARCDRPERDFDVRF